MRPRLAFTDHRADPQAWAYALRISRAAVDLYLASDVIDLHVDSFLWTRMYRYDLTKRHGRGLFGARVYSQVDLPRVREARLTGGIWVITTNPLRRSRARAEAFVQNIAQLRGILESCPDDVAIVRTAKDYREAVAAGKHAAWIGIQGGNALDCGDRDQNDALDRIPDGLVVRVTLVHLYNSKLGVTSAPPLFGGTREDVGLSKAGRAYVERLDERKIFVDLAHISRRGFFDAVETHDRSLPLIVTHTGVAAVTPHWRNLDDEQLRAIADSGGTIGVMYHSPFLGGTFAGGRAAQIVDHLDHVVKTVGDDHVSLGSDWDGAIVTPRDMQTCLELPRLVQIMLDRGWREESIRKVLGGNFLRALRDLRGE
jgi:membrane dipeptidase